jgi:flagellar basal-body rod protein FlgC
MKVSYLAGMNVSASGLAAQRTVMNTAAENLANAQTTRTETGGPYRRKIAYLSEEPVSVQDGVPSAQLDSDGSVKGTVTGVASRTDSATVSAVKATVTEDTSELPEIYDPGHPDADDDGMVRMPNVDTAREMVTLLAASRAYEANVAALQASKKLAESSLNLAR